MGTAKISDITSFFNMTAGNIDKPGKTKTDGDLFAQAMTDAAGKGAGSTAADTDSRIIKQTDPQAAQKRIQKHSGNTADRLADKTDNKNEVRTDSTDKKDAAAKKLDKLTGEIKDAVKEELSVDDEQLEQAMAALGLSPMDLLDSDNIKNLMLELSGEQDPMVLITNENLLNSIGNVTEILETSVNELTEEFGISAQELAEIVNSGEAVTVQAEEAIAAEAGTEDEDDPEITVTAGSKDIRTGTETSAKEVSNDSTAVTPTQASLQRKEAAQAGDRQAEGGMQNAMQGQELQQQPQVNEAAAAQETAYTSQYVDREDILRQVTDNIKLNISPDSASMELVLHPASLGTVNLQIASNGGVITANLQVQNEAVKSVLETQLVQLLETFEEQGQKVEAIEVSVAGYDLDRSLNQESGSQEGERKEGTAQGIGRTTRRRLNLNDLDEEEIEELTEEEQLTAEMMAMNGGNVDFLA